MEFSENDGNVGLDGSYPYAEEEEVLNEKQLNKEKSR